MDEVWERKDELGIVLESSDEGSSRRRIVERDVEKMKRAEKKKRKEMRQMAQTQSQIVRDQ